MSNLSMFLKKNKKVKENTTFAVTKSLQDEEGNALLWEIKPITTKESEKIRSECTIEVPIPGKKGMYRQKLDTKAYLVKLMVNSIVYPDLKDEELQDSYGVCSEEELLLEMVDDPSEYNEFAEFIQKYNGFDKSLDEKVDEAKNS